MTHKLKPYDLTNLLLKSNFEFSWGLGKDRLVKFDIFVNELKSKFCVVDWGQCNEANTNQETEKAKIELMSLCAGPQLRDIINSLISDKPILFEEMIKLIRNKLMKDTPPLLLLATLLSESQGYAESFEDYHNRVQVSANKIDWDSFTPENIKKALIATTFASRSLNPFVKGHCLAVRDMSSINLQDILNTAHEYEEKNPAPASFPQVGNSGSLFGSAPSGAQGGLFGAAPTGNGGGMFGAAPTGNGGGGMFGAAPTGNGGDMFGAAATGNGGGLFGAAPTKKVLFKEGKEPKLRTAKSVKCTHNYRYDKDGNLDPSSSNTGSFRGSLFDGSAPKPHGGTSLFGSSPVMCQVGPHPGGNDAPSRNSAHSGNGASGGNSASGGGFGIPLTPFNSGMFQGGFNNNIFMSDGNGAKEEEAAVSQPSTEGERQSSDAGPSDKAP
ncbi:uncharacterized transmembrane protein DDB_G0289901-like [Bolinopsis microptera]|uniref:uncharacterized transmembrane protein DDB_G0289901-like n=1 Tax=Bolinopsis microptera TaxID=2820187 RepID=UPI003079F778